MKDDKKLVNISIRVDMDKYKKVTELVDFPSYVRWLIDSILDKEIEIEAPKIKLRRKK